MKEIFQNEENNDLYKIENKEKIKKNESIIFCFKCREKYNIGNINYIISNNNKIKDSIYETELQIENIIKKDSLNLLNIKLKNINQKLLKIIEDINKNNEIIFEFLNDKNKDKNNDKIMTNNDNNNIKSNKKNLIISRDNNVFNIIKSIYLIKIIFSNLKEKIKLKIVKYHKSNFNLPFLIQTKNIF